MSIGIRRRAVLAHHVYYVLVHGFRPISGVLQSLRGHAASVLGRHA
nr:MAG TPA: hypothetical protein [Caudoviricetes sp.]